MKTVIATGMAAAVYLLGLMTYEAAILALAAGALALAVISLLLGADNRRDIKAILEKQNERAGRLVKGLEGDVATGED